MNFGLGEIIILVFVLVVVFSAARMGQLGNAVGKFVHSYKKASRGEGYVDAGSGTTRISGGARRSNRGTEDAQLVDGETHPPKKS